MARIRTVKPEYWTSEQVVDCSPMARLLFIGMLNFADDNGVLKFSARTIKANVFPGDDDITSDIVRGLVAETVKNGLLGVFEHQGVEYLHILSFRKHQRIDKPTYKYPHPPKNPAAYKEWSSIDRRPTCDLFDDRSAPEGKGMETKGREGKGEEAPAPVVDQSGSASGKSTKAAKGSRLDPSWAPTLDDRAYAAKAGLTAPEIDAVAERFRRYFTGPDAKDPVKRDWHRAWCNWVDRDAPDTLRRRPRNGAFQTGDTGRNPILPAEPADLGLWRVRMDGFRKYGAKVWLNDWGPKPGEHGCQVPTEALKAAAEPEQQGAT